MRYSDIRGIAKTGDVLLVEGRGFVSQLIRAVTGQSMSHVAVLVWFGETLWVAEMKEFFGYRLRPASLWIEDALVGGNVYFGEAPQAVRLATDHQNKIVLDALFSYRNTRYSYAALVTVWWAQIRRKKLAAGLVCSTFVQRVWEATGYEFRQTADPGDYVRLCESVSVIKEK